MRLVHTLVSATGFRNPAHTERRLATLDSLLAAAAGEQADLVVLPGGYLTAVDERAVRALADAVADLAGRHGPAVVGGIDVVAEKPASKRAAAVAGLPFFGFATTPTRPVWRQTSTTRDNSWDVPDGEVPGDGRVVPAAGSSVGVLVCGELFSDRARQALTTHRPAVVLDLGHAGMGQGLIPAMRLVSRLGRCAVAHSQHVASWGGQCLHFVGRDGGQESRPLAQSQWVGDDEFWIGWTVRQIG